MKDAYYFSHDSNAKDDPKCMMLIETLQLEGYGIFWMLVETLRDQPEYKYPLMLIPALARRYNTTTDKIKAVIHNYGLFQIDDREFFYSDSLNMRMIAWDNSKEKFRLAGIASGKARRLKALEHRSNDVGTSVELLDKNRLDKNRIDYIDTDLIIDYFNKVTGKKMKHKDLSRKPIKARLNDGFNIDDCKKVIDIKNDEWKDDNKMSKFIRITTLFSSKFEAYLNQTEEKKVIKNDTFHVIESTNEGINDLIKRVYNDK